MKEVMSIALEDLILYNNHSFLIPVFLIALVVLWCVERDRRIRVVLLYLSIALIGVFFCPLYAWIGQKIDKDIYYRVFWTLPIGLLFCYAGVRLLIQMKRTISRILFGVLIVVAMVINGKFLYGNTIYNKSTNAYHIPEIVLYVAEAVKMENYKPIAVFPAELLPFLRQYTGDIYTPYGRNMMETQWNFSHPLYDAMEAEVYDAEEVALQARAAGCCFVVLSSAKEMLGSLEDQNYILVDSVAVYDVYMDYYRYEVLWEQGLLDEDLLKFKK